MVAELEVGALKSVKPAEELAKVEAFVEGLQVLPFGGAEAMQYAEIRVALESQGNLIGANDLLIAATAQANDLVLVTGNDREFSRVAGLRVECWS